MAPESGVRVHIVIVGCGRVGSSLGKHLSETGHSVAVVDRKSEAFVRLGENYTGQTITGIGFDRDTLLQAGIEKADAVAAVTNGDNSNVLVARVAREMFGIQRVVARIYDPKRAEVYQRLGIATVATVSWTTERVLRRLTENGDAIEWTDPSAKVSVVERNLPRAWAGRRYSELEKFNVRVVAVTRLGSSMLPTPDLVVQEGDLVYLAVATDAVPALSASLEAQTAGGH